MPIACVDLIPVRGRDVGLIRRHAPFADGERWCHLGGRVLHGETLRAALLRHLADALHDVTIDLPDDPQPDYVSQWFPSAPDGRVRYGVDPRRHAVALGYVIELDGTPGPNLTGEALEFDWHSLAELHDLGDALWPGTEALVLSALAAAGRI